MGSRLHKEEAQGRVGGGDLLAHQVSTLSKAVSASTEQTANSLDAPPHSARDRAHMREFTDAQGIEAVARSRHRRRYRVRRLARVEGAGARAGQRAMGFGAVPVPAGAAPDDARREQATRRRPGECTRVERRRSVRRSGRRRRLPAHASGEGEAHERHLPRAGQRQLRAHRARPLLRERGSRGRTACVRPADLHSAPERPGGVRPAARGNQRGEERRRLRARRPRAWRAASPVRRERPARERPPPPGQAMPSGTPITTPSAATTVVCHAIAADTRRRRKPHLEDRQPRRRRRGGEERARASRSPTASNAAITGRPPTRPRSTRSDGFAGDRRFRSSCASSRGASPADRVGRARGSRRQRLGCR